MNFDQLINNITNEGVEPNIGPKDYLSTFKKDGPQTGADWLVTIVDPVHWLYEAYKTGWDLGLAITDFENNPTKENAFKVMLCVFFTSLTIAPGVKGAKLPIKK